MAKYLLLLSALLLPISLILAQEDETLINFGEIESSGFGAAVVKFSPVKGETGVWVGGYGGWLINHSFMIGGGGYGLASRIEAPSIAQTINEKTLYLKLGYGGFMMEYIYKPDKLIHLTFNTLIGAGSADYSLKDAFDTNTGDNSSFFVWENQLNAELNISSFVRFSAGFGYRYVSGVDLIGLSDNDLRNISVLLTFKFGSF